MPIPVWALTDRDCSTDVSARGFERGKAGDEKCRLIPARSASKGFSPLNEWPLLAPRAGDLPLLRMVANSKPGFPAASHPRRKLTRGSRAFIIRWRGESRTGLPQMCGESAADRAYVGCITEATQSRTPRHPSFTDAVGLPKPRPHPTPLDFKVDLRPAVSNRLAFLATAGKILN